MKKIIDTQTTDDPNIFGEALREYCFKEEYGCYSCFDLIDGFKKVKSITKYQYIFDLLLSEYSDIFNYTPLIYKYKNIIIAWYWDGDGTLFIQEGERKAINTDCKKSYTWEWIDEQ